MRHKHESETVPEVQRAFILSEGSEKTGKAETHRPPDARRRNRTPGLIQADIRMIGARVLTKRGGGAVVGVSLRRGVVLVVSTGWNDRQRIRVEDLKRVGPHAFVEV